MQVKKRREGVCRTGPVPPALLEAAQRALAELQRRRRCPGVAVIWRRFWRGEG